MIQQDKILHFVVAMLLIMQLTRIFPDIYAILIVFAMIVGKELYDLYIKKTFINYWDIVTGILGMSIGLI